MTITALDFTETCIMKSIKVKPKPNEKKKKKTSHAIAAKSNQR